MQISSSMNHLAFRGAQGQKQPGRPQPQRPGSPAPGQPQQPYRPPQGQPGEESAKLPVPDRDPGACKRGEALPAGEPLRTCFA